MPAASRLATSTSVLVAFAVLALGGSPPATAQSVSDLSARADEARGQAEALAGVIESQTGALITRRQEADSASSREADLSSALQQGKQRAAELTAEVDEARERVERTRRELRRSVTMLADRLVAIYKDGGADALQLLLNSDGYDDLTSRAEYVERIREADEALVDRARELRARMSEDLATVSEARERQRAHNAEVAEARDQIAAVRAQAQARAAALLAARGAREDALAQLRAQIDRWEREVQRAQRISAAQAEQQVADQIGEWAIPEQIVDCESGGDFGALNPTSGAGGAYQILPATWKAYGGKGKPHEASPEEQARIAALIWADSGGSAWVCSG